MTTAHALEQAKAALIGRALTDSNRPGSLPCPDTDNDGVPQIFVGSNCPSYTGRFPWRTLQSGDLRDADGERVWYGLTSTLRDNGSAQPINSATPGQLLVDTAIADVVVVLIAPGTPFASQNRNTGPNNASNYLEDENNDGDNNFVTAAAGDFNDRLIFITRQELMAAVEKRVLGEIRGILRTYYQNSDPTPANRYYPYAAALGTRVGVEGLRRGFLPLSPPPPIPPPPGPSTHPNPTILVPSWFTNSAGTTNDWEQFIYYAIGTDCTSSNKGCNSTSPSDFLTAGTTQNINALVISAGRAITAAPYAVSKGGVQDRTSPPPQLANEYLDSAENADSDDTYDAVATQSTASYNDQMKIVAP